MRIYKFGGASIKDADSIRNVGNILSKESGPLVVVISAMGKTTNKLEQLISLGYEGKEQEYFLLWQEIVEEHLKVAEKLRIRKIVESVFVNYSDYVKKIAQQYIHSNLEPIYDEFYDQLIFLGEMMSTKLVYYYFKMLAFDVIWKDARDFIQTDCNFRLASIKWSKTIDAVQKHILQSSMSNDIFVTQGFIGCCSTGKTTSLGREGSDYTAAILAYCLAAESVTVWKDVPGVLTADPRKVSNAELIQNLSFRDAIELTYYGAQVIHPKTIQPLQKKNIPLYVRSFIDYQKSGTKINSDEHQDKPAMIVITENQYLVQISSKDYSFIAEKHLSTIFSLLNQYRIRVNLMRNSAISFSVSVSAEQDRFMSFIDELDSLFMVDYEKDLTLITIRHFRDETVNRFKENKKIIFEEKHGITHQMIVK